MPKSRVLINGVDRPVSRWRYVLFRRIGAQYPDRNFDEVNPKLFVLAGEAKPPRGDGCYEG